MKKLTQLFNFMTSKKDLLTVLAITALFVLSAGAPSATISIGK